MADESNLDETAYSFVQYRYGVECGVIFWIAFIIEKSW